MSSLLQLFTEKMDSLRKLISDFDSDLRTKLEKTYNDVENVISTEVLKYSQTFANSMNADVSKAIQLTINDMEEKWHTLGAQLSSTSFTEGVKTLSNLNATTSAMAKTMSTFNNDFNTVKDGLRISIDLLGVQTSGIYSAVQSANAAITSMLSSLSNFSDNSKSITKLTEMDDVLDALLLRIKNLDAQEDIVQKVKQQLINLGVVFAGTVIGSNVRSS